MNTEQVKDRNEILFTVEFLAKRVLSNEIDFHDDETMLHILVEEVIPSMTASRNNNVPVTREAIAMVFGVCSQLLARGMTELTNTANTAQAH